MKFNLFNFEDSAQQLPGEDDPVILEGLTPSEWSALLEFVEVRRLPSGARFLNAGEVDRTLYILRAGKVEVDIDAPGQSKMIATINAGSVFGELAFFDGAPRLASVYALEDCEVLALSYAAFSRLAAWHPRIARELLFDLGRVLSGRLRRIQAGHC